MDDNFKLLKKTPNHFEAHAIKSFLASHGIECQIPHENMITTYGQINPMFGPFEIMVYSKDYENALEALEQIDNDND